MCIREDFVKTHSNLIIQGVFMPEITMMFIRFLYPREGLIIGDLFEEVDPVYRSIGNS